MKMNENVFLKFIHSGSAYSKNVSPTHDCQKWATAALLPIHLSEWTEAHTLVCAVWNKLSARVLLIVGIAAAELEWQQIQISVRAIFTSRHF